MKIIVILKFTQSFRPNTYRRIIIHAYTHAHAHAHTHTNTQFALCCEMHAKQDVLVDSRYSYTRFSYSPFGWSIARPHGYNYYSMMMNYVSCSHTETKVVVKHGIDVLQ